MNKRRIARMNEQLRREISEIIQRETRDPRIGAVTVTDARVTPDLQQARIFVSVAGDADEKAASLEGLTAATPFIRSALAGRLELRRIPELIFNIDASLDYAMHIERLLHEVLPHGELPAAAGDAAAEVDGAEVDADAVAAADRADADDTADASDAADADAGAGDAGDRHGH